MFLLQFGVFVFADRQFIQLFDLVFEQLQLSQVLLAVLFELLQLIISLTPVLVGKAGLFHQFAVAGVLIQHRQLLFRLHQLLVGMLTMDVDQQLTERF